MRTNFADLSDDLWTCVLLHFHVLDNVADIVHLGMTCARMRDVVRSQVVFARIPNNRFWFIGVPRYWLVPVMQQTSALDVFGEERTQELLAESAWRVNSAWFTVERRKRRGGRYNLRSRPFVDYIEY